MAHGGTGPGSAAADAGVTGLAARAVEHLRCGELAAAHALYAQILDLNPDEPEALSFVAVSALQKGDLSLGVALLERGVAAHPSHADLQKNLGIAYRAAGQFDAALAAFAAATELKPDFTMAFLNQGALLVELGRADEAVSVYLKAIDAGERSGQFLNPAAISPGIRVLLDKASHVLRGARRAALDEALRPLESQHGQAALVRVRHCLDSYLGLAPPIPTAPGQRPMFMTFPGLPAKSWHERADFPWMPELEHHAAAMREELQAVLVQDEGFRPFIEMPEGHPGADYWRGLNRSRAWDAFFFYKDGTREVANHARCPRTSAALEAAPLIRIGEHSPETLFSVLKPGAHIPAHTGVINVRLVVHLPLMVPPDCGIRVGEETRHWEEGKCLVFDDTYEHEAWNKSAATRVVLILDVWNPFLTPVEQEAMRLAIEALGAFHRGHGGKAQSLA